MQITPVSATDVPNVPVGSFFLLKAQGGAASFAFMGNQVAAAKGHFNGPVVVRLNGTGGVSNPTAASRMTLAIAAIFPPLTPFVDLESVEESSTEAMRLSAGRLLCSDSGFLLAMGGGDLGADNFVNLNNGDYAVAGRAGKWLSFSRWGLRAEDGSVVYSHDAAVRRDE